MPSSGGGSSKTQTVTQNNSPWSGVQGYLTDAYKNLSTEVGKGAPEYYPGNTVAPFSQQQQQSIQGVTNLANGGNPTLDAANQQLQKTINGDYLNSNPYFSQVAQQVRQPVDSEFASGGRYMSGQHDVAVAQALAPYAYQNYAAERQNQLNAINQAPGIDQARYYGYGQLGNVGAAVQQQGQNVINADVNKYDYNTSKDYNWLNQYIGTLNGATGGSQVTTTPLYQPSPWQQAAGAGLGLGGLLLGSGLFGN